VNGFTRVCSRRFIIMALLRGSRNRFPRLGKKRERRDARSRVEIDTWIRTLGYRLSIYCPYHLAAGPFFARCTKRRARLTCIISPLVFSWRYINLFYVMQRRCMATHVRIRARARCRMTYLSRECEGNKLSRDDDASWKIIYYLIARSESLLIPRVDC